MEENEGRMGSRVGSPPSASLSTSDDEGPLHGHERREAGPGINGSLSMAMGDVRLGETDGAPRMCVSRPDWRLDEDPMFPPYLLLDEDNYEEMAEAIRQNSIASMVRAARLAR